MSGFVRSLSRRAAAAAAATAAAVRGGGGEDDGERQGEIESKRHYAS